MKKFNITHLALLFFAVACLMGVATSLMVKYLVTNQITQEAQERVKEDLNTARWVYMTKLKAIDRTVRWTSIRHVLKTGIRQRNVSIIEEELAGLIDQEGLDFLTLVDRNGEVIFRFHNPHASGDNVIHDPFIRRAMARRGISGTQILSHEDLKKEGEEFARRAAFRLIPTPMEKPTEKAEESSGMVLRSAHPIYDFNGALLGVLAGGVLLNRNYEIVDRIKNIVFKDAQYKGKEIGTATIFMGDLRISTNVMDKEGNRAIVTRVSAEVYEQIFEKGKPWIQRAFVVDDWYITAYEPIYDYEDKIVGILYVGMLESKYAVMKANLILVFFLLAMTGMLVALAVSFVLSWKMLRK